MTAEATARSSRRAVLGGAVGAAAALAVNAVARPSAALAADPLLAGVDNVVDSGTTSITSSFSDPFAVYCSNDNAVVIAGTSDGNLGVGVYGSAGTGTGVKGSSSNGTGVYGTGSLYGVYGETAFVGAVGVYGSNTAGSGANVGVHGVADNATSVGVRGQSASGVGVHAFSTGGVALKVTGKVQLSRSGKTRILAGKSSLKVTLAGVSASSMVFAVLASNRSGRYVRSVVSTAGSFTVYLNTTVASDSWISWVVVN